MREMLVDDLIKGCVVLPRHNYLMVIEEIPVYTNTLRRRLVGHRKQGWMRGSLYRPPTFSAQLYRGSMLYLGKEITPTELCGVRTHYTFLVEKDVVYMQGYEIKHLETLPDIYESEQVSDRRSSHFIEYAGETSIYETSSADS